MFGRLAAGACAESLEYGPVALDAEECSAVFASHPGFLSTGPAADTWHLGWWQLVTADGFTPLFHIFYKFADVATLADRFAAAAGGGGVAVDFEVWDAALGVQLATFDAATYCGATGAFDRPGGSPFAAAAAESAADGDAIRVGFSGDDWCWGAKGGTVDCSAVDLVNTATVAYGVAVRGARSAKREAPADGGSWVVCA
jgi:hypothetical protein